MADDYKRTESEIRKEAARLKKERKTEERREDLEAKGAPVYTVVCCKDGYYLLATKNKVAKWFDGKAGNGNNIKHNPGMQVFPGGRNKTPGPLDKTIPGPILKTGIAEFAEETGFDVQMNLDEKGGVIILPKIGDHERKVIPFECAHTVFSGKGEGFGVCVLIIEKMNDIREMENYFDAINNHDQKCHEDGKHNEKYRWDDELKSLKCLSAKNAAQIFINEKNTEGQPNDWFRKTIVAVEKGLFKRTLDADLPTKVSTKPPSKPSTKVNSDNIYAALAEKEEPTKHANKERVKKEPATREPTKEKSVKNPPMLHAFNKSMKNIQMTDPTDDISEENTPGKKSPVEKKEGSPKPPH